MDLPPHLATPLVAAGVVFVVTFILAFILNVMLAVRRRRSAASALSEAAGLAAVRWRDVRADLSALRSFAASGDGVAVAPVLERLAVVRSGPDTSLIEGLDPQCVPNGVADRVQRLTGALAADPVAIARDRIESHFAADLDRARREDADLHFDEASQVAFAASLDRLIATVSAYADRADALRRDLRGG